jgi:hypothetical protein
MIARGASLTTILEELCRAIDAQAPECHFGGSASWI